MIYTTLRGIVKLALNVFFKRIIVTGTENIPDNGPLIIVANHPNTLMDPLIVSSITARRIGFVANAGIFTVKPIAAFFRYFHVIPIFRKKDVKPGETPDNSFSFRLCHHYLADQGALLIFPEGSSYHELKLREIKTGTARIALSFEAMHRFESGLKILPVALDYSDALQFRSMVSVTVHPPIETMRFREAYHKNEFDSVRELTEDIRKALAKNIPQTSGKEQEAFLIKAHKFYTAFYDPGAGLHYDPKKSLMLRSQLSGALQYVNDHHGSLYAAIQDKVNLFFSNLKRYKVTEGFFSGRFLGKNPIWVCLGYLLIFILLLPVYLIGLLVNYLPYILPSKIFLALKTDIEYKTSVQLVAGVITFPLFYALEILLFRQYVSTEWWYTFGLLLLFPLTGYVAMYFWTELKRFVRVINFYFFMSRQQVEEMLNLRDEILRLMEQARQRLG